MKIHTKIVWDADGNEVLDDWFDYIGPIAHAGGGSSKQTQQTSTGPWTVQQPYLAQGFSEAYKNYQSDSPKYYPDSTVTPFSDATNQGLSLTKGLADSSALPGQAADQVGATTNGAYLRSPQDWASNFQNPNANVRAETGFNPFMMQGPNGYGDAVTNSITRSVIPQVTSQFAAAGRTGESPIAQQAIAKGIADALAPYQFNSAEAEAQRRFSGGESLASRQQNSSENQASRQFTSGQNALSMGLNAYDAERQRQLSAAGMAPSIDAARYAPADALLKAGSQEEQKSGQYLQDQIDRFNFDQNLPTQKLNDFMAQIQGNYGQAGTNISNASYQQPFAQTFAQIGQGLGGAGKAAGK